MAETFEAYRTRVLSYLGDEEPIGVQQATPSQLDRRLRDVAPEEFLRTAATSKTPFRRTPEMSTYLTFTREKTLDETEGPTDLQANSFSNAPGHTETEGNATAGTFEGGAGAVLAGKTPLGRLGRVTDIAPLAVFLASGESSWITGEVIRAAGGLVVAT
jgi:hypothetical protein